MVLDFDTEFVQVFSENLDWVFLVDWILLLFASISIIFYFNRYLGSIVSFFLNLYVWNKYKVRIKIKAVKISFLGGRIFFKNLIIITQNETISILQGTLTWRYWLKSTMKTDLELENAGLDKTKNERFPSRFILQVYGLEWFMYNRVYAYDNLMDFINKQNDKGNAPEKGQEKEDDTLQSSTTTSFTSQVPNSTSGTTTNNIPRNYHQEPMDVPFFSFLNALPMFVDIKKGSVAIGNKTTSSILVLSFSLGDGLIDITRLENPLDFYKSTFKMNFKNPKVIMKPNLGFKDEEEKKDKVPTDTEGYVPLKRRDIKALRHRKFGKLLSLSRQFVKVATLNHYNHGKKSVVPVETEQDHWHGLQKYIEYDASVLPETSGMRVIVNRDEYLKYSVLLDLESLLLYYYYDVCGTVPTSVRSDTTSATDINNSDSPPVYGIYLSVSHGLVHYGPWANRERVGIQKMLFPTAARDLEPHLRLNAGDTRKYCGFKLEVNVADELIFRVPFREFSKNTKVEDQDSEPQSEDERPPFGWLELKMHKSSSIVSETSYIPSVEKGWDNTLRLEVVAPELRTSMNHDLVFKASRHILQADIGFPLKWNGLTNWKFHNRLENSEIFLLREHITLFSDLVSDFSFGPPAPYELFKPFIYDIDIEFTKGYKLFLNVNDNNIINNPLDFNDNLYLSFQGDSLFTSVNIPLDQIALKATCVSYELATDFTDVIIDAPPWHTLNNFLKSKRVGRLKRFFIEGSYTYHSGIGIDTVDNIVIDCSCEDTVLELYGFVLRYALLIKENYFGIHKTFKTLLEYTDNLNEARKDLDKETSSSENEPHHHVKTENEMDLTFTFNLERGCLVLPSHLYNSDSHVALYFDTMDVDIRYTNYYMDLQCDISEIKAKYSVDCESLALIEEALTSKYHDLKDQMVIESLCVHGHRMFGLPPLEPTYFCKWDFDLGAVSMATDLQFLALLLASGKNIKFSLKDIENLLVSVPVVLHDVVVLTFACPKISIETLNEDGSALQVVLMPLSLNFNDMLNQRYSKRLNVKIPLISVSTLDSNQNLLGSIKTSLYLTNFVQNRDFELNFDAQQHHLCTNDGPFHRLPFMVSKGRDSAYNREYGSIKQSFSIPNLAPPINAQSVDFVFEDLDIGSEYDFNDWENIQNGLYDSQMNLDTNSSGQETSPRSYYEDSDFMPASPPDSMYEYDNIVASFGPIEAGVSPESMQVVIDILDKFNTFDVEGIMDALHLETILGLRKLSNDLCTVLNARVLIPSISLKYGEFIQLDEHVNSSLSDHLELSARNLSLALSVKTTRRLVGVANSISKVEKATELSVAVNLRELGVDILRQLQEMADSYSRLMLLHLHDIEFWATKTPLTGIVGSTNTRKFDFAIDADSMDWLGLFCSSHAARFSLLGRQVSDIMARKKAAVIDLMYDSATASAAYHIQHDPAVLTKPAYIMRSSDHHIRTNDSWKVLIRLRHILKYIPSSRKSKTNACFKSNSFYKGEDASWVVLDIFKNWRSWEFNDISQCYLFRKTFNLDPLEPTINLSSQLNFNFALESLSLNVTSADRDDDYIHLNFLNCSMAMEETQLKEAYSKIGVEAFSGKEVKLVVSVESMRDSLSPLSLKLWDFVTVFQLEHGKNSTTVAPAEVTATKKEPAPLSVDFCAIFKKTDHRIKVDKTGISSTGEGFTVSVLTVMENGMKGNLPFTWITKSDRISFDVFNGDSPVGTFTGRDGLSVVSSVGTLKEGLKSFNLTWSEVALKCDQGTDEFILLFDTMLNHDVKVIESIVRTFSKTKATLVQKVPVPEPELNPVDAEKPYFHKAPIVVQTAIGSLSWDLELVSPLRYVGRVKDFRTNTHIVRDTLVSEMDIHSAQTRLMSPSKNSTKRLLLKTDIINLSFVSRVNLTKNYDLLDAFIRCDRSVLTIPELMQSVNCIYENGDHSRTSVEKLTEITNKLRSLLLKMSEADAVVKEEVRKKPLLIKLSIKNKYSGIVTRLEDCVYRLDSSDTCISGMNYSTGEQLKPQKPYGELALPMVRVAVNDGKRDNVVLAIDVAVKTIFTDSVAEQLRNLQVELHYCRLFLNPQVLLRILTAQKAGSEILAKIKPLLPSTKTETLVMVDKQEQEQDQDSIFGFHAIHILAYNICLGWIFDDPECHADGIIAGCERIFVVCERKVGKLTLVDAYLSLAHGSLLSSFFATDGEFDAPSRAFLPHMQFTYAIVEKEGHHNVHSTVTGEQLDVRFEADGVNIIDELVQSVTHTKRILDEKSLFNTEHPSNDSSSVLEGVSIDKAGFHSVECITRFAGAKVVVYNTDGDCLEDCSSFTLRAPAIRIALQYLHNAKLAKKHRIKVEIITSPSKNTLYATCVPVLNNLYRGVRKMMKGSTSPKEEHVVPLAEASKLTLLDDVAMDIGIRIEAQEIALSCEPTAKVEATASCRGLDLRVGTTSKDIASSIWSTLKIEGLRASLQHVYSRETSGSVSIEEVLVTGLQSTKGAKKITLSLFMSKANAFINVKQLQDLDLFRDIWVPKEFYRDCEEDSNSSKPENTRGITLRAKLTSSTDAIPWMIMLLVLQINLTVDMGNSLGIMNLCLDRLWAVSKKSISWEQSLRLSVNNIGLTSEGRLGGKVSIQDVTILTAISWMLYEKIFEHPLVVISCGIGSIRAKSALDYHTFFVGHLEDLSVNIFNKRGKSVSAHDSLFATADVGSLKAYFTALAASNFWDIYNTALRIHNDIQISYREVLKDSSANLSNLMLKKLNEADDTMVDILNGLTTNLDVKIKSVLVHIYPSSLMDSQVLVFALGEANAKFYQNTAQKLEDRLEFKLHNFTVSLSTFQNKVKDESDFNSMDITDFFQFSKETKKGTIFVFPSMAIDMDIFQTLGTNVIEYKYKSSFGGKVDIRWNLGSVNFIRDMWTSHANALSSRLESYRRIQLRNGAEIKAASNDKSLFETANLEDKLKDVETASKYDYVALEPMVAEMPQLKELGEATPPLEWFGLHREKFPNVTHQMIIISLQKMVHEVETQYGRILK